MALTHRDVEVTREQVYDWVQEARRLHKSKSAHVKAKLQELQIADEDVVIADQTYSLHQMILDDLDSYR